MLDLKLLGVKRVHWIKRKLNINNINMRIKDHKLDISNDHNLVIYHKRITKKDQELLVEHTSQFTQLLFLSFKEKKKCSIIKKRSSQRFTRKVM